MRVLNAKDIESLENTSVAVGLAVGGVTAEEILAVECGPATWFECYVLSCLQDSACHTDSNCPDVSNCNNGSCVAVSCALASNCAEDSGCDGGSGCDLASVCEAGTLPPHTGDVELAVLLRQAVLE